MRADFAAWFDRAVPDGAPYFRHTLEGPDDMPAHIKSSLLGPMLTIPVSGGRLALGTWQGIYLCEHRDDGGSRRVVVTGDGRGGVGAGAGVPDSAFVAFSVHPSDEIGNASVSARKRGRTCR